MYSPITYGPCIYALALPEPTASGPWATDLPLEEYAGTAGRAEPPLKLGRRRVRGEAAPRIFRCGGSGHELKGIRGDGEPRAHDGTGVSATH